MYDYVNQSLFIIWRLLHIFASHVHFLVVTFSHVSFPSLYHYSRFTWFTVWLAVKHYVRIKQTYPINTYYVRNTRGNNLSFHRAQRLVTCSSFFLLRFRYAIHRAVCVSVGAILPRRTALDRTRFFHPSFFAQISISSERVHRLPPRVVEDRNLFQIRHVESIFLSNTSRFGFTWPTFHTALTPIYLTRNNRVLHAWLVWQAYCRTRC